MPQTPLPCAIYHNESKHMLDDTDQTIYLKDYKAPSYLVETVSLHFVLSPKATRVISKIAFTPNPTADSRNFFLHGEQLNLIWAKIDGQEVSPTLSDQGLTVPTPDAPFIWEAEVEISPEDNTALSGLYMSNGMYCTQCEAEGFRRITYYPDRPDVLAIFDVTIESDLPILLSNGNLVEQSDTQVTWHDPRPKPAYLFALVAGHLVNHADRFETKSGRYIELNIWVRPGDEHKCAFGMEALKASMKWDEDVYGLEYDLDLFNIVAVDDFNMGAMENKGLNIFNSAAVLASPDTSTDANFERIEAIVAHEYFHNWTGNRITCRDWFQLCLKEGLTVYRDGQFTSDMRSASVKRIEDAVVLRQAQFPEDNGPLAHAVRPDSFVEINNFYTATIYEKGAELIGMLKTLVGEDTYYKAVQLYVDRHDGQAATLEDWLQAFEDSTGRDLSQFKIWYEQAGTPRLKVTERYDDGSFFLDFEQSTPPTPNQDHKDPRVIPIAIGLLSPQGEEIQPTAIFEMTQAKQSIEFKDMAERPIPSILRNFSAPVILEHDIDNTRRSFLMAHDSDPFNRWEASQSLAMNCLISMITENKAADTRLLDGYLATLRDDTLDPSFRALVLQLPSQSDIAQTLFDMGQTPDPEEIYQTVQTLRQAMATHLQDVLPLIYAQHQIEGPYSPDATQAGARKLANCALGLIARLDGGKTAEQQFQSATNMTQQLAALSVLVANNRSDDALEAFYEQWKSDRLVMDKWFGIQISAAAPDMALQAAQRLVNHPDFTIKNPNRFRSVLSVLASHQAAFHTADGSGYKFVSDWLIELDKINPQATARSCGAFQTWKRFDKDRQNMLADNMERILAQPTLSRDTKEMLTRILDK